MGTRLLLIDENRQLLTLVGDYLSNRGYEVHRAGEADEAEALLRNYQYSIVIAGAEWKDFGCADGNLTQWLNEQEPRPRIVRMTEARCAPYSVQAPDGETTLVIEKPISLLHLHEFMEEHFSLPNN